MNGLVCYQVTGEASSSLLCRLTGLFAQLDLPAPQLTVEVEGERMRVTATLAHFGPALVPAMAHKMARFVGVESVLLDGVDLEGRSNGPAPVPPGQRKSKPTTCSLAA